MTVDYSAHRHNTSDSHFLLVKTESNESADQLIAEINGKIFHGIAVIARRFIKRQGKRAWHGQERRSYQLNLDLIFSD